MLIVVIVVLAAAATALDFVARDLTERAVASDVKAATHAQRATVSISSFPFIYGVAVHGRVDGLDVNVYGVPAGLLSIDEISLDVKGVRIDQHRLLADRTVSVKSINSATINVVVKLSSLQNSLASDLGVEVSAPTSQRISFTVHGVTVATIDLTRVPIVPSCALDVTHTGAVYTFSCTVAPVPASVLGALSKATGATQP